MPMQISFEYQALSIVEIMTAANTRGRSEFQSMIRTPLSSDVVCFTKRFPMWPSGTFYHLMGRFLIYRYWGYHTVSSAKYP